jgi:hypothetical protein
MGKRSRARHSAQKNAGHQCACQTATAPCSRPLAPLLASSSGSRVTRVGICAADTDEKTWYWCGKVATRVQRKNAGARRRDRRAKFKRENLCYSVIID